MTEIDKSFSLSHRRNRRQRETVATLLESVGFQREYLISVLLAQSDPEAPDEVSLKVQRTLAASLISHLVPLLRATKSPQGSKVLDFCSYLHLYPLTPSLEHAALILALGEADATNPDQIDKFRKMEVLNLLARLGDFETLRDQFALLSEGCKENNPCLSLIYRLSWARYLQFRGHRLKFLAEWLNLICDYYQREGSECALYLILRWIGILNWGRESELKHSLLLRFGAGMRGRMDLISATLLYEIFSLDNKLVPPNEKMNHAKLLLRHPTSLLAPQQLQFLHFFAGNYSSGMKLNFHESIRAYQHANYYLHKSWDYLRRLSEFLRVQLTPGQYVGLLSRLEQWVMDLGSQVSLQNNAYVETLHADYATIRDLYKQVEELSVTDTLTGLKNRRYLTQNLQQVFNLAARQKVPICLAMLDIDNFKPVNDNHGHPAGDQVLKSLAKLLSGSFRKSDVIIRFGGDEFLLVLFDIAEARFLEMMEELRRKVVSYRFRHKEAEIRITLSIGTCCGAVPAQTRKYLQSQIDKADAALYQAKNAGGNRVICHTEENPA